jgi:predicted DNA-binding transcriptional regulator AlpA
MPRKPSEQQSPFGDDAAADTVSQRRSPIGGSAHLYLIARQVRDRYGGISDMSLWRWLHDGSVNFPSPRFRVHKRRYWLLADIEAWEAKTREET